MRCNYGSLGWGFHFLFNNNIHHGGHCSKGTTYIIRNLDMDARIAHAEQLEVDYYTHPQDLSNIDPIHRLLFPASQPHRWGAVQVMMKVYGYRKIRRRTLETFEVVPLPSKTLEYVTKGLWFDIDPIVKEELKALNIDPMGAIHGAGHMLKACIPMLILCDPNDVNCEHSSEEQVRIRPWRITLYDTKRGGIGVCYAAFHMCTAVVELAMQILDECGCENGCPSCLHDFSCSEYNDRISKQGAKIIFKSLHKGLLLYSVEKENE
eukprot:m.90376 g.90376  ORF g.90376 m.90376 type:complete len:264 (+) comp8850_c1_seq17:1102-1893(+)